MELPLSCFDFRLPGRTEMTKGYVKNPQLEKMNEMSKPEAKVIEFINSRGTVVELLPLPPYMVQMAIDSVDRPQVPTYKIQTEGADEEHPYDEVSIADPKTPAEDQEAWLDYLDELSLAETRSSEILVNLILSESVNIPFDQETETSWVKKMKMIGMRVPEDHEERLLMYKKQYVVGNSNDIAELTQKVMSLTLVSKEEVDLAKKSFQDPDESNPQKREGKAS
jgi:hypothetical protein